MACIDIFAPGRLMSVPFLAEQIWLRARGKRILATEVYDFLLRLDDGGSPLHTFYVASPHFCRKKTRGGGWKDNVHVISIGDSRTKWGWFYYGQQDVREHEQQGERTQHLVLQVPESVELPGRNRIRLEGEYLFGAKLRWHPALVGNDDMVLMQDMKKSLYEITVQTPLLPRGENQMWFRLIVEPVLLDVSETMRGPESSFVDWVFPQVILGAKITCPWYVRKFLADQVGELPDKHPDLPVPIARLQQTLIANGVGASGTSTRIEEHRLMLAGSGVRIGLQGGTPPTLAYFGTQYTTAALPPFGHDYESHPEAKWSKVKTRVHHWAGGSARNGANDLVAVAESFVSEASISPKRKEELVYGVTPGNYREGCALVDKLVEVGLLRIDDSRVIRAVRLSDKDKCDRLCQLRRLYLDADNFESIPEARQVFTDLHPFTVDFEADWIPRIILRRLLLSLIVLSSVLSLVLSICAISRTFSHDSDRGRSAPVQVEPAPAPPPVSPGADHRRQPDTGQ